ncbi:AAA family ATPase [Aliihoeflea sp. 2WW]|uniref:AAA family ATPase n=1 Tax=Aliihoeflea sp. 2WW TaxID=1381123 RepID=UPI000466E456|nr:AAA family ATPase [Aliihoeflea sp. 2WW]
MKKPKNAIARLAASLPTAIAYCAVARAMRNQHRFNHFSAGLVVLKLPPDATATHYRVAAEAYVEVPQGSRRRSDPFVVVIGDKKNDSWPKDVTDWLSYTDKVVALCGHGDVVPLAVALAADAVIELDPVKPGDIVGAWKMGSRGPITRGEAELLLKIPFPILDAAARTGRSAADIVSRVTEAGKCVAEFEAGAVKAASGPYLDDLVGMGEAEEWGRELALDLADWKEGRIPWSAVDRGILLSGPPGCGKTTFAKALANTCGVELVSGSLARWQAAGYLNSLLKSMREAFATAKEKAPSILFIDEIDAFGDRAKFNGHNEQYCTEVVAGLLECLDGVDSREGVIVVGAANHPARLDAAITRSGRLDRHVRVSLPDREGRAEILHRLLGNQIDRPDLESIAARLPNRSGADLGRLAREAIRRARRQSRFPVIADLEASLPERIAMPKDYRWRIAVHEAGHAVIGLQLGYGAIRQVRIPEWFEADVEAQVEGAVEFEIVRSECRTLARIEQEITTLMAGAAAERMLFGDHSAGVGGKAGSDLHRATALATAAYRSWGLGDRLTFMEETSASTAGLAFDPAAHRWVSELTASCFERALRMVRDRREAIEALAQELLAEGTMTGVRVAAIVPPEKQPVVRPRARRGARRSAAE